MRTRPLLAARVRWDFQNDRHQEAVALLIDFQRVATLIQKDSSNLVNMLVGASLSRAAMEEMIHLAREEESTEAIVLEMAAQLPKASSLDESFITSMKGEYHFTAATIDQWMATDVGRDGLVQHAAILDLPSELEFLQKSFFGYRFHPNRTKQIFADYYRAHTVSLPVSYLDAKKKNLPKFKYGVGDELGWKDALKSNALGASLCHQSLMGYTFFEKLCEMRYQLDANRAALALFAHRKRHGEFPPSLKGLEGLAEIPIDPFDGKPPQNE